LEQVVWLSLVTASVAFTLCEMKLFAELRNWVKRRSVWRGKLICCGYCLGHWVAFCLVAIYRPMAFEATNSPWINASW
jgi:hypothetical protein